MESGTDTIFERIGTRHNMEFISGSYCAEITDVAPLPFRCFSDNQISIQSSTVACDYTTGIAENKPDKTFIIAQPANEKLNGRFLSNDYNLKLVDALGKTAYNNHYSENAFSIDVSELPVGIYFLEIRSAKGTVSEKILIQH